MKIVLKLLVYVAALALFAAGAFVIGTHAGAALSGAASAGTEIGELAPVELVKIVLADVPGSPAWHLGVGAGLAALGLLLARPVARVTLGVRRPRRAETAAKSLRSIAHDLGNPDPSVRLEAAKTLTRLAKPATIPALMKALRDPKSEVRGQACEGLSDITGFTFDFVDIAPESVREESIRQWQAWWQTHKAAILAGRDPRSAGASTGLAAAPVPAAEVREAEEEPSEPELLSPDEELPAPAPVAGPSDADKTPPKPTPALQESGEPGPEGRNVSVGDLIRRKRRREGSSRRVPSVAADKDPSPPLDWPVTGGDAEEIEDADLLSPDDELPPPPS